MNEQIQIQDVFLNVCRREKQQVTVFLMNGVKLQGVVSGFDEQSLLLRRSTQTQLVYKHSIATIVPSTSIEIFGSKHTDPSEGEFQIA
jgi:host factor-I protein